MPYTYNITTIATNFTIINQGEHKVPIYLKYRSMLISMMWDWLERGSWEKGYM